MSEKNQLSHSNSDSFITIGDHVKRRVKNKRLKRGLSQSNHPRQKSIFRQTVLYGVSTCMARTILAPLERIQIVQQVQHMANVHSSEKAQGLLNLIQIFDQGLLNIKELYHSGEVIQLTWLRAYQTSWFEYYFMTGLKSFSSPSRGINMEQDIKYIHVDPMTQTAFQNISYVIRITLSASISSMITLIFSYPFDLLHTRMAAQLSHNNHTRIYPSLFKCFNKSTIRNGMRGLYQGFQFTTISQSLYFSIMFPIYEIMKAVVSENKKAQSQRNIDGHSNVSANFMNVFSASTLAIVFSVVLLYPLDTVRKCVQMNASIGNADMYKGSIDCFKSIYQYDGVRGFYRGITPCILRKIPLMVLGFTLFEYLNSIYPMNKNKARSQE